MARVGGDISSQGQGARGGAETTSKPTQPWAYSRISKQNSARGELGLCRICGSGASALAVRRHVGSEFRVGSTAWRRSPTPLGSHSKTRPRGFDHGEVVKSRPVGLASQFRFESSDAVLRARLSGTRSPPKLREAANPSSGPCGPRPPCQARGGAKGRILEAGGGDG
eukprot:8398043-Pyramimonas_sp.AAC.1